MQLARGDIGQLTDFEATAVTSEPARDLGGRVVTYGILTRFGSSSWLSGLLLARLVPFGDASLLGS